jgi:hypothetical protein
MMTGAIISDSTCGFACCVEHLLLMCAETGVLTHLSTQDFDIMLIASLNGFDNSSTQSTCSPCDSDDSHGGGNIWGFCKNGIY